MFQRRFLLLEYAFGIFFLFQALYPQSFLTTLALFIGFVITKYLIEGFRLTIFMIIIAQLVLFISSSIYTALPVIILLYAGLNYFPIYKFPNPSGQHLVGYKRIHLQGITNVGVYYPTDEVTRDVKYSPDHSSWERFADLIIFYGRTQGKDYLPKFLFKIALSFFEHLRMGVNEEARLLIPDQSNRKLPVVVFSHGLSANMHLYSLQIKEWASHGFIVFSIDHDEEICLEHTQFKNFQEYVAARILQLNDRKKTAKQVLDFIFDESNIQKMFGEQGVLDSKKVFFAGHSFGAATMSEVIIEDKRAAAGLVLLDPYFEFSNQDILAKPQSRPLLSLRSNAFELMNLKNGIIKHAKIVNQNAISGYFKDSVHNSTTDLLLLIPRELKLFGKVRNIEEIEKEVLEHAYISTAFLLATLDYMSLGNQKTKETIKSMTLERFRLTLERKGKRDNLVVDDLSE